MGLKLNQKLPSIFLVHGLTDQTIEYPDRLDDVNQVSPELIVAWATVQKFKLELKFIENLAAEHMNKGENETKEAK